MNNYYETLGMNYKFSPIRLLLNYLHCSRKTLNSHSKVDFIKVRQGYEVLRQEESIDCYNRIFKKYILKQTLNYPPIKEQQMIRTIQEKEDYARNYANELINRNESFLIHLTKIAVAIILADLSKIFLFGASGIVLIATGLIIITIHHDQTNLLGGTFITFIELLFFRRNIKWYVIS